jgi:hypothetical protein
MAPERTELAARLRGPPRRKRACAAGAEDCAGYLARSPTAVLRTQKTENTLPKSLSYCRTLSTTQPIDILLRSTRLKPHLTHRFLSWMFLLASQQQTISCPSVSTLVNRDECDPPTSSPPDFDPCLLMIGRRVHTFAASSGNILCGRRRSTSPLTSSFLVSCPENTLETA